MNYKKNSIKNELKKSGKLFTFVWLLIILWDLLSQSGVTRLKLEAQLFGKRKERERHNVGQNHG